jgi:hypothetical protein
LGKANDQKKETKNPSRREFLKKAAKGGSIAALIAGGALDFELRNLLLAQELSSDRLKHLSKEALEMALPTRSLETLRNILKGEYYRGGRFFKDFGKSFIFDNACHPVLNPLCPPVESAGKDCKKHCKTNANCPKNGADCHNDCNEQDCKDYDCDNDTCPDGFGCHLYGCDNVLCGGAADGCDGVFVITYINKVDPREISAFSMRDIERYTSVQFVSELMEVMNMRTAQNLQKELYKMIENRETLQMKGYVK